MSVASISSRKSVADACAKPGSDRLDRKATGLTALDARENDFDLMGVQIEALKKGASTSQIASDVSDGSAVLSLTWIKSELSSCWSLPPGK